ncbi:hypothetical protein F511_32146 [Dorcoceras hygrometricum]|uniref:Uncharacterized protein n=1 Tax=Dorcoceras hygrometricum TaxID=472368 RepID=A0A2Z7DCV2_9LAMI|nr:hypothetical protein F511_32146 [Dorcoceras hygrometricum]
MANQIKRRNVSSLTYENFPRGHPSQYCSHPCTLNSTLFTRAFPIDCKKPKKDDISKIDEKRSTERRKNRFEKMPNKKNDHKVLVAEESNNKWADLDSETTSSSSSSESFSFGESSSEETSTQSNLANDKFKKMNFFKASVTHDVCESVKYDDQFTGQMNHKGKNGIGYVKPENGKPRWLTNRLEKDKAKAVPKSSVPN